MLIPCKQITSLMQQKIRASVQELKQRGVHPKLLTVLLGDSPEQQSFVSKKKSLALILGIDFEFLHYTNIPSFNSFLQALQTKVSELQTSGVIIQLPLPPTYHPTEMYSKIPMVKDIEGHKPGSTVQFPLSLAVLTGIKYIYGYALAKRGIDHKVIVEFQNDIPFFQEVLAGKNIVIAGRGETGGKPIGKSLSQMDIPFTVIHSQTENAKSVFQKADIIITATGKKILDRSMLKPGVVLLNVGLRKDHDNLRGDYDEDNIKDIASFYTETPGGLGPLDVMYLYNNLIDAANDLYNNRTNSNR